MRLLVATTTESAAVHPGLPAYMAAMMGHCPYLGPSMNRELTTWSAWEATPDDRPDLLGLLVETAEELRAERRVKGKLVCANLAIVGPTDIPSAKAVLDWPHWLARKLYAPVEIMVGKFWIGEQEEDKHGVPIAPPPVSFFSIRHSTIAKDGQFLYNLPGVAEQLRYADEDNRDVLMSVLGVPCTRENVISRYAELVATFPAEAKVTT